MKLRGFPLFHSGEVCSRNRRPGGGGLPSFPVIGLDSPSAPFGFHTDCFSIKGPKAWSIFSTHDFEKSKTVKVLRLKWGQLLQFSIFPSFVYKKIAPSVPASEHAFPLPDGGGRVELYFHYTRVSKPDFGTSTLRKRERAPHQQHTGFLYKIGKPPCCPTFRCVETGPAARTNIDSWGLHTTHSPDVFYNKTPGNVVSSPGVVTGISRSIISVAAALVHTG